MALLDRVDMLGIMATLLYIGFLALTYARLRTCLISSEWPWASIREDVSTTVWPWQGLSSGPTTSVMLLDLGVGNRASFAPISSALVRPTLIHTALRPGAR